MRVVVAGSGIAGVVAALRAKLSGNEVVMVSSGKSASSRSLGVVDVLGYLDGEELGSPVEGIKILVEREEEHPYSLLGVERVRKALEFFREVAARAGIPFRGSPEENIHIATQFGTIKPTCLAPEKVYAGRVEVWSGKRVVISGEEERNFSPRFVAASLAWLLPELGMPLPKRIEAGGEGELVLLPVRQLNKSENACALPLLGDGRLVVERLIELATKLGVRIVEDRITGAEVEGGELKALVGRQSYAGDAFVLATGDWVGGGLAGRRETLLGLELVRVAHLAEKTPLPAKGHPYSRLGVKVDENLSPFYRGEKIVNLKVAGALLGGYDYCAEKSGWGVAIATGYKAGGVR
jgi:glycerol-3-phosphate dehydrogenase subunit B